MFSVLINLLEDSRLKIMHNREVKSRILNNISSFSRVTQNAQVTGHKESRFTENKISYHASREYILHDPHFSCEMPAPRPGLGSNPGPGVISRL